MSDDDLQRIGAYMMPLLPACASDLGFLFGTRHGVQAFCDAAYGLWEQGMFSRLLVSGGTTGSSPLAEADVIAGRLIQLGIPESVLILETAATNTGENVRFGMARVGEMMDLAAIRRVVVIGKVCSTRRYLMTLRRHWPDVAVTVCPVNYLASLPSVGTNTPNFAPASLVNSTRFPVTWPMAFSKKSMGTRRIRWRSQRACAHRWSGNDGARAGPASFPIPGSE
jgi:uncharacterized SAM-binding protein YcdF (DUF218 family)